MSRLILPNSSPKVQGSTQDLEPVCYIIHFLEPYWHARHYVGMTYRLWFRLYEHRYLASGAKLMQAVNRAGIPWVVAAILPGGRETEKAIKQMKNTPRYCPICRMERTTILVFESPWLCTHRPRAGEKTLFEMNE